MASTTNEPVTVWAPTDGNSESIQVGIDELIDELSNFLIDELSNELADTGIDYNEIPATVWTQNDGV